MAASNTPSIKDQIDSLRIAREEMELTLQVQAQDFSQINSSISSVLGTQKKILKAEQDLAVAKKIAIKHQEHYKSLQIQINALGRAATDEENEQLDASKKLTDNALKKLKQDEKAVGLMKQQVSLTKGLLGSFKNINATTGAALSSTKSWFQELDGILGGLNDSDKAIRELNLSLGNSGMASERMRDTFIESGAYAAKFGMSVRDLTAMQGKYSELTGRVTTMNVQQAKAMVGIAKGTTLGAAGAAQMAANFQQMGVGMVQTGKDIEGFVNDSAAAGVNASNVLQTMTTSFAKAQEFTFVSGRAGLKDMAINAQKMKISMESTFAAADKARTLKGSLDMASQLMVLGGRFAQADPFQLSFLARNDPAKFQEKLADMTKGMASFNKATGEMSVSAYDMDRLRAAAEATGVPFGELVESSKKMAQMAGAKSSLFVGTPADRDLIAQMADMGKDGSFSVNLGGTDVALNKLTQAQVAQLKTQKSTLEQRARDSQSFDELFKNTMMEMKAVALPFLKTFGSLLGSLKEFLDKTNPMVLKTVGAVVMAVGVASMLGGVMSSAVGGIKSLISLGGLIKGGGSAASAASSAGGSITSAATGAAGAGGGGGAGGVAGKLGGSSVAATLVAVGVAAVGMGYGLKLATEGIAKLAEAMKGMTGPEVAGLVGVVAALSLGFVAMAFGVASFANPMSLAGVAVVAGLSLTMIGMGYAIKLATDGVATMFTSMSSLAGLDLSGVGAFFGMATSFLAADSDNFSGLMATVLFLKTAQTSMIAEMREVMATPVTLQLAGDNKMMVNVEVVNNIDGDKFVKRFTKPFAVELQKASKGQRSLG